MSVSVSGGPGSCRGHAHVLDRLVQTEVPGKRTDHRQIHADRRRRRRPAAATTGGRQVPAVGGDHVGVEIADDGRAAELAGQPVAEGAEDRPVLPPRARRRRPGGDPLGLAEQVARVERRDGRAAGRGRGCWPTRPHRRSRPARRRRARAPRSASGASASCSALTANAYSRNRPCRVDGAAASLGGFRAAPSRP